MKLHLPVGLRTALLAALASFSVAFGQITVKQSITEESEGSDVDVTDGTLNDTLQGDVLIEVDGTDGDATLSLSGDISQDATTTITVGEGGEIKTTGRLTIGTAGSLQEDPGKESVTIINVNGGKFDASASSSLVIGWGNGQDSVSRTTINVSDGGSFILGQYCTIGDTYRGNSHSETVINVTGGGTFRNNKGEIGRAGWSTAFDSPHTVHALLIQDTLLGALRVMLWRPGQRSMLKMGVLIQQDLMPLNSISTPKVIWRLLVLVVLKEMRLF